MSRKSDFLVGLTIIVTSVVMLVAVVWVQQSDISSRREHLTARFSDIGNARVGNAAVIRGVRQGRIDRIELDEEGAVLVRMSLDRGTELPRDPVVLLNESSLFGEWQATITERSAVPRDEAVLRQLQIPTGASVVPGATLPGIAKLTVVAGQIAGDVASVAERVDVAFDDAAAKELRLSIRNFAELSSTLAGTVRDHATDLDTLSAHLRGAVLALGQAARTTQVISQRVDSSMTSGELRALVVDLGQAAAELRRTTQTLSAMTAALSGSQGRLDSFLANSDSVLRKINTGQGTLGRMVNDSSLYVGTDSLVTGLRALVAEIRANPRKFFSLSVF